MYFVWEELHISKSTDFLKRQEVEVSQVVARQVKVLPPNEILVFRPNFTFFSAKRDKVRSQKKKTILFGKFSQHGGGASQIPKLL